MNKLYFFSYLAHPTYPNDGQVVEGFLLQTDYTVVEFNNSDFSGDTDTYDSLDEWKHGVKLGDRKAKFSDYGTLVRVE